MTKIYYISQGRTPEIHLQNIRNICEAGCGLVQLRLKDASLKEYIKIAGTAQEICNKYHAKLIINDNIEVAKQVKAYGVHLGKNDISPLEARSILGNILIGGTANTYDDCINLIHQKVDYIGLGPYKFTTTKKNLSPLLGLNGYSKIISKLRESNHLLPIVAIGGITENDFEEIYKTGVSSIAVSGLLTEKPIEELKNIITKAIG